MMGLTSAGMVEMVAGLPNGPVGFGANCGVGASDLLRTVLGFAAAGADRPVIAKGNAGIPRYVHGHVHYDGTPALMAEYAVMARDAGARIIGGCCGTTPDHLRAMRAALEAHPPGPAPTLERISAALGPFSSELDGTETGPDQAPERPRRRRRRR
jgi:5-methyltetrahydrofolate--homocysteine methyltransferase